MQKSPRTGDQLSTVEGSWHTVTVNATGPIENDGAYVYIEGDGISGWAYVPPLIALSVNQTALACISDGKKAFIETSNSNPPVIQRFHILS